jgi:hypothetical protein
MKMNFDQERSRRDILKLGAVIGATSIGASLLHLSGTTAFANHSRKLDNSKANRENDIGLFMTAAQLEQKAINTYTAAKEAGLLKTPMLLEVALQFASDHAEHRDADMKTVRSLGGDPVQIKGLGTAPIPDNVLKGTEEDVLRYALGIELIAAKTYQEFAAGLAQTPEGVETAVSIMAIESQHAATYRAVLLAIFKKMGLPEDPNKIVPYGLLKNQPKPAFPTGKTLTTDASTAMMMPK